MCFGFGEMFDIFITELYKCFKLKVYNRFRNIRQIFDQMKVNESLNCHEMGPIVCPKCRKTHQNADIEERERLKKTTKWFVLRALTLLEDLHKKEVEHQKHLAKRRERYAERKLEKEFEATTSKSNE